MMSPESDVALLSTLQESLSRLKFTDGDVKQTLLNLVKLDRSRIPVHRADTADTVEVTVPTKCLYKDITSTILEGLNAIEGDHYNVVTVNVIEKHLVICGKLSLYHRIGDRGELIKDEDEVLIIKCQN